jgi:hypothetical protein
MISRSYFNLIKTENFLYIYTHNGTTLYHTSRVLHEYIYLRQLCFVHKVACRYVITQLISCILNFAFNVISLLSYRKSCLYTISYRLQLFSYRGRIVCSVQV